MPKGTLGTLAEQSCLGYKIPGKKGEGWRDGLGPLADQYKDQDRK